ncbi:hypothetical protein BDV26DRAFT_276643 [Aspergillus bertholletiae]|uniref:Uncharacterized protein n=1 Tax=Aspergillus bertholletiae TaxID=1226010 RepID=A0A5N7AN85_9EURO|nr:hypothetical protein BDV26DRAFT_276643 [Aspergillus bertholletiae]
MHLDLLFSSPPFFLFRFLLSAFLPVLCFYLLHLCDCWMRVYQLSCSRSALGFFIHAFLLDAPAAGYLCRISRDGLQLKTHSRGNLHENICI